MYPNAPQQYPQPMMYPPATPPLPQGYPAQPQPQAYGQPYGMPAPYGAPGYVPPAPTAPPTATGSLDAFYGQQATGSKSWVFKDRPIGTAYAGVVARPLTDADVRQQTSTGANPMPLFNPDGSPKFVMVVPMAMQPTAEYPDGQATWWVKGQARDDLTRAMAEAGAPAGPPEHGAYIHVQLVQHRPTRNGNPAYVYRVTYQRPTADTLAFANAAPAPQAQPAPNPAPQAQPYPGGASYAVPAPQGWPPVGAQQAAAFAQGGIPGLMAAQQAQPYPGGAAQPITYEQLASVPAAMNQPYQAQQFAAPTQAVTVPVGVVAGSPQFAPPVQAQPAMVPGIGGQPVPALNIGAQVTAPNPVPQAAQGQPPVNALNQLTPEQQAQMALLVGGQPA